MTSPELKMIVNSVASEFRCMPYNELLALVSQGPLCFERENNGNVYSFEIHAESLANEGVRVRVAGELLGSNKGFAEYFGMTQNGGLIEGERTWF